MNGAHDLGGMHGFGPVEPEADEPPFHGEWERRVFALTLAMGYSGLWNLDMSRDARERQHPRDYLSRSYYETWLHGLTTLLQEQGVVGAAELNRGQAEPSAAAPQPRVLAAADVADVLARGGPVRIEDPRPAAYKVGDRVRVRNRNPRGHTRAPRYVRGRRGRVIRAHGVFIFPDSHAARGDPAPQHLYSVRFEAAELWGEGADPVYVDLFEPYLEPERAP